MRTPCTLPLDPPLTSEKFVLYQHNALKLKRMMSFLILNTQCLSYVSDLLERYKLTRALQSSSKIFMAIVLFLFLHQSYGITYS